MSTICQRHEEMRDKTNPTYVLQGRKFHKGSTPI